MKKLALALLWLPLLLACSKNEQHAHLSAGANTVVIDSERYAHATGDPFTFESVKISGDEIQITIRYGGGCREVYAGLVDGGSVAYSNPPQRTMKMILDDRDGCEALMKKMFSFDLKPIRLQGTNKVQLRLDGWGETLLYTY